MFFSNLDIGRRSSWLLYVMLLALHKDLSVDKSWDLQYNREGYMALALVKYEDIF